MRISQTIENPKSMVIFRQLDHVEKRGKTRGRSTKDLEASECKNSVDRRNRTSVERWLKQQIMKYVSQEVKTKNYLSF